MNWLYGRVLVEYLKSEIKDLRLQGTQRLVESYNKINLIH